MSYILWNLRDTRTVFAIAVGTALGIVGTLIQGFSRNPLADPGILGVNAGAAFFVVLSIAYFGTTSATSQVWFALGGAFAVTLCVYLIGNAGRGRSDSVRFILGGVALATILTGISTAVMLRDPTTFHSLRAWSAGSLVGKDMATLLVVLPLLIIGFVTAGLLAQPLNAIALGEEMAISLGSNVRYTLMGTVLAIALLAGTATAIAGPISFLGLMVPHAARRFSGHSQLWIMAYSAIISPILRLSSDVGARIILAPGEVPVGIVTAFVGAPIFIYLARRRQASSL